MESVVAWVKVTHKRRLTVLEVDAERHPLLVEQLGVTTAPALVLVEDRRVIGLLEGRVSGREIDQLIRSHLVEGVSGGGRSLQGAPTHTDDEALPRS
jgi:thioredoxin-like negative regulator of GroEL